MVGLFNVSGTPQVISTSVSALGMKTGRDYLLTDLWTHCRTQITGTISAEVPSHGVALFRISPLRNPAAAPPAAISNPSLAAPWRAAYRTSRSPAALGETRLTIPAQRRARSANFGVLAAV